MIDVAKALAPPAGWTDTPEQAQVRACLIRSLEGHDPVDMLAVASGMITLLRDQILTRVAQVRREAAHTAHQDLSVPQLVEASGQTKQTIARLLSEYRVNANY